MGGDELFWSSDGLFLAVMDFFGQQWTLLGGGGFFWAVVDFFWGAAMDLFWAAVDFFLGGDGPFWGGDGPLW